LPSSSKANPTYIPLNENENKKNENKKAYRIAQELHCDRYAECSATTGELMAEAFEDIAALAAKTITENEAGQEGGDSGGCVIF
jgi:hypothetical protein